MRLLSASIGNFKNLRDFSVIFDPASPISVVVGRNGSGKSNLIEALTVIFRDLDLGEPPTFRYSISYECHERTVQIDADPTVRPSRSMFVDGQRISLPEIRGIDSQRYLPDFVFGYYSGPTNRLQKHFEKHQSAFNRALREGREAALRRLFYARPEHSQFVLLAFFLEDDPSIAEFLHEYLGIDTLESVLFVLREPPWRRSSGGNPRFWHARGVVADLLATFYAIALAPIRLELDFASEPSRKRNKVEHLYLFLKNMAAVRELAAGYGESSQELFKAFESILAADLLDEVRVRVRARGVDGSLVFRELSEGEQQLLMVLGLLRFTQEQESLFLLDEPDTHLNPAWSVRYTQLLSDNAGLGSATSQLLMATHDPLVVASLVREQVIVLERDYGTGKVTSSRPEVDPRGMGVAGLLTSDVYGLPSDLDLQTLEKLERRRWLASADTLSVNEAAELHQLTDELEGLEFTFTSRDPLYAEFERAVASVTRTNLENMSSKDVHEEHDVAESVLRSILTEREARARGEDV